MSHAPFLSRPSTTYKASYIVAQREYQRVDGKPPSWKYERLNDSFEEFVAMRQAYADDPPTGYTPQIDYWLIVDGAYAGEISIRHPLTAPLREYGGHIGYRIRPSMRRKGYGTLQLSLALDKCREMGLERVLITCDDDNTGSIRIIEANGGVLQDKLNSDYNPRDILTRRYWIELGDD